MNRMHAVHQTFARSLAFVAAASLFAGCAGASHLLPAAPVPGAGAPDAIGAASSLEEPSGKAISVRMEIRIPRRSREHARTRHPATISPLTQSLSIAANGKKRQVFNTTPASPGCSIGVSGTTCTFAMLVKPGTDTFVVNTYAATGGTGAVLDRGIATVPITKGKVNTVAVRLGPAVTTTADSGAGSLRYAIGSANSGDTILFLLPAGSTIALASPITISGNVTLAGPGAATPITISGGNAHQLFFIEGTATISGLTLTQGKAAVPASPGGAIFNIGTLTLANDRIGGNTSTVSIVRAHHRAAGGDPAASALLDHISAGWCALQRRHARYDGHDLQRELRHQQRCELHRRPGRRDLQRRSRFHHLDRRYVFEQLHDERWCGL